MAWIYLFIASFLEVCWTFSLKYMEFKKILKTDWRNLSHLKDNLILLLPLIGYIVFGLGNIYFFSMAMKQIPVATAMAIWFGLALIGVKLVDTLYFKEPFQLNQILFFALILIGVIGLKRTT